MSCKARHRQAYTSYARGSEFKFRLLVQSRKNVQWLAADIDSRRNNLAIELGVGGRRVAIKASIDDCAMTGRCNNAHASTTESRSLESAARAAGWAKGSARQ